jgi:glycosyltransferase involved in cell wall biosynthesis
MRKGGLELSESRRPHPAPLTVLESVPKIRPTTNPYITQLVEALGRQPDIRVRLFSFRTAILGRYDVLHIHWPETLISANSALKRWRRRILTLLVLARIRFTRRALVRTWHNLERPEGLAGVDHFLLDRLDRLTTLRISLNPVSTFPDDTPFVVIPHGHYRDWYGRNPSSSPIPGRIACVGLIRRYKGIENLLSAFGEVDDPGLSLRVAGKPSSAELADGLTAIAADDPRVSFAFAFLDDGEFTTEITRSELIVLPYHHMHNSGMALAALSLGRRVLVPDTEFNRLLADEVGPGWISFFSGPLDASALRAAIDARTDESQAQAPDLRAREWPVIGSAHAEAFRTARKLSGRRRP